MSTTQTTRKKEYFIFPGKKASFDKLQVPLSMDMHDFELANFMAEVDKESIERQVTKMIRLRSMGVNKDGKREKKEYLVYYETWYGYSSDGNPLSKPLADVPNGFDYEISRSLIYKDSSGEILPIAQKNPKTDIVYSIEWDKDVAESILDSAEITDRVEYIIEGTKSWGGYSQEEFMNLSFPELDIRGSLGRVSFPLDTQFSNMSGSQRLEMERKEDKSKRKRK